MRIHDPFYKDYTHFLDERLGNYVQRLFGLLESPEQADIVATFEWIDLPGGAYLCRQGDEGDSMYVLISGRLKVLENRPNGKLDAIAEIPCGETVGEMSLITGEPRNAHVLAMRDCVLARISKQRFELLGERHPHLLLQITRKIIQRLRDTQTNHRVHRRVTNICLMPISASIDGTAFAMEFLPRLKRIGTAIFLDSPLVDAWLNQKGLSQAPRDHSHEYRRLTSWLEEKEGEHRFVVYCPDATDTEWTRRCLRQADEIVLLADPDASPELHPMEKQFLHGSLRTAIAEQSLVLWHPAGTVRPVGTLPWLENRELRFHHHLRKGYEPDLDRLARIISGKAVGLVLSGGAAKGFAHIGAYRALEAAGIPVDMVGGTSIGAVMGALIARGWKADFMRIRCREVFKKSPTRDFNLVPRVSIFKGKTLEALLAESFDGYRIEDTWLSFFCVSCNLTKIHPTVHWRGDLTRTLRASISIPGIFPPAEIEDDLHVDGGVFNNFPVDIMSKLGVGTLIAIDLQNYRRFEEPVLDADRRRKMPSLLFVVMEATMLSGRIMGFEYRKSIDVYINPPLSEFSLVDWHKFDQIEEVGFQYAQTILADKAANIRDQVLGKTPEPNTRVLPTQTNL